MIVYIAIVLIALVTVTIKLANPASDEISNKEYEALFKKYVYIIDNRHPQWIDASLRELKRGYSYYWENPRAMSTLELLEEACNGEHPDIVRFILSCNKYRKKRML